MSFSIRSARPIYILDVPSMYIAGLARTHLSCRAVRVFMWQLACPGVSYSLNVFGGCGGAQI